MIRTSTLLRVFLVGVGVAGGSAAAAQEAKNLFVLISDGAGFNQFNAASMYQHGDLGRLPYEQAGWTKVGASTHPLTFNREPDGAGQDPTLVYDPAAAWDTSAQPVDNARVPFADPLSPTAPGAASNSGGPFAGYNFLKSTYTDSAAAGTAIAAGVRTFNSGINWTNDDAPLTGQTIAELARANNRATGVVSSVYFSHATPATMGGAHNVSRGNTQEIANQMLDEGTLDLIFTPGHPEYDDAGNFTPLDVNDPTSTAARNIGGTATYVELKAGTHAGGWDLVEDRADFEALAADPAAATQGRLLGLAQSRNSLQYLRPITDDWDGNGVVDNEPFTPFFPLTEAQKAERQAAPVNPGDDSAGDPFNAATPTLATLTKAAIHQLDAQQDREGMYLMVEGAQVDWAGHGHNTTRLIEEQVDFNDSVDAVLDWVAANDPNFDETLVMVLADHEAGMLWGPDGDTEAFDLIETAGIGNKPEMLMQSTQHTNQLVPIYARGVGAALLNGFTEGVDTEYLARYGMAGLEGWGDGYVGLTASFEVMSAVVPEPSSAVLAAAGGLLVLPRRRRRGS
ncbi:alkaline phosphatase [Phycisphaera mikurensis]|uniref:Alkaline phosphatase n=1 Tax=Phycisphaera mikurensis (strain NBRC 102666 / KCTC 22515 / FYK2301M01) TaxID=1142394 RepID=I0IHB2_PHYMF|nr:alkaline phosphatase [Phycisphaera mikurensis]MBB6440899.1 alkaline phosphatase [Phycisphaera mikurensis]BAM04650.1 alkaline phosphatase [Phycisphaera mikurensis NBRC 102666]